SILTLLTTAAIVVLIPAGPRQIAVAQTEAATAAQLSGEPILIGIAVAQTTDTALLGQEQVIGAQIAESFFNQRGGVNGRPIKLVYQDAAGAPETAINAFNTLING